MDNATINYVEDYVNIGLPRDAAAILLIEVDGHPAQVADEAVSVEKVLKDSGALEVVVAKDAAEKTRIWEARRVAIPALARCRPTLMLEDATVPRSKIPAMLEALDKIAARRYLRPRRGRQSAPVHPLRQARQGRVLPSGAGR